MTNLRGLLAGFMALALGTASVQAEAARQPLATIHTRAAVTQGRAPALGRLPATQRLHLSIALPPRDQAGLDAMLADITNPKSPNFRHYLSVAQFTERFGPSEADYTALIVFAGAHGLQLSATSPNRMLIEVDGAVGDIERAFQVTLGLYRHPTEPRVFYAPDRAPTADLAVPIWHIGGLDNYSLPRSQLTRQPAAAHTGGPADGSGPDGVYLSKDMRVAYYGGTALTGAGQSVGLLQFGGYWSGDVDSYFSTTGQTNTVQIENVLIGGATNCAVACDDDEEVADIVQSIGMAPGLSKVIVYTGTNDDSAIVNRMASDNLAKQLSVSWTWDPADPSSDDPYFEEMAAQGQSIFVASGDCGSYTPGADPEGCSGGSGAYGPQFPPEDTYVTAVGGTALSMTGSGAGYQSETGWSGSGGGYGDPGFALPSWQSGLATASNNASTSLRNIPDVAADANTDSYYCSNGACDPNNFVLGGTSLATPRWAGFIALVNQQAIQNGKPTVGFLNPTLYTLLAGNSGSGLVHDTQSGSNGGFSAVTGYDLVTGWGSPNGQSLIDALSGAATSQAPSVTALSPASGPATGGTAVTITGSGFGAATAVAFGSNAVAFTVVSNTEITTTTPAATPGSVYVTVKNASGTSASSAGALFTYTSTTGTAPKVMALSPASGPTGGGTTVTLTGSNFTGATGIAFGGTAASSFTVVGATQITAVAPAEGVGTVDVKVTTPAGTSATGSADQYTYVAASGGGPTAPIIAFGSGNFTKPTDVALDAAGDIFVVDAGSNAIKEIPAANPSTIAYLDSATDFNEPFGIAVDGSGNLFVADTYNNRVVEIAKAGGYTNVATIGAAQGNFQYPTGLALDAAGDVFVLDWGHNALKEIVAAGGYHTVLTLATTAALNGPYGIALDASGNIFIGDSGNGTIKEVTTASGYAGFAVLGGSGTFSEPYGIAVDTGGNLFVSDKVTGTLSEIAAAGGYGTVTALGVTGLANPAGLALDGGGDIFVADEGNHVVKEIVRAAPSAASPLAAAILPGSRAVQAGSPATVFATLLNSGGTGLGSCAPALLSTAPAGMALDYRPTNPTTNQPSGTQDVPVSIAAGGAQSFVLAFGDNSAASVRALPVVFSCADAMPAPSVTGLDTVDLLFSATPVADIIALAATSSNDGTVHVAGGAGAFAVATIDAGAAGSLTATLDTGAAILPLTATICQTNASGQCQAPPSSSLAVSFAANATPTFSVFVSASGSIAFAPGTSRIFLRFVDSSGVSHGSTSVAVTTG